MVDTASPAPLLSVVVPVHDEDANVETLVDEIARALRPVLHFEMLFVDDASRDRTLEVLRSLKGRYPELRVLRHHGQCGQSTAVHTGIRAARADWIATLDGDGQNDPADLPTLLAARDRAPVQVRLFQGWRTTRKDSWVKRVSSSIANAVRSRLLGDATPDTGCGIKLIERAVFLELPYFDHMHRFLPALVRRAGFGVQSVPVSHRPRLGGRSKYGVWNRLWVGMVDIAGVAWLSRRYRQRRVSEED
ncbi:MAG: glycosyltransferase family 2 protein [Xanthomonadales bacterium]|nr:glycosyltransferase family 2 protein [Xanthomonadales bacterium]